MFSASAPPLVGDGMQSHAWLQQDSAVIDITADQFPGVTERIIVANAPTAFHLTFSSKVEHVADFRLYDGYAGAALAAAYARIKSVLEAAGAYREG
jgi:hypothetical protein